VKEDIVYLSPSNKPFQVWFLIFPSMMVTLHYESIFGSELLEVCVFIKFLDCVWVLCLWFLLVNILTVDILEKRNGYTLLCLICT
jgi:hypothetical protein